MLHDNKTLQTHSAAEFASAQLASTQALPDLFPVFKVYGVGGGIKVHSGGQDKVWLSTLCDICDFEHTHTRIHTHFN